jgi:hypothetical protein
VRRSERTRSSVREGRRRRRIPERDPRERSEQSNTVPPMGFEPMLERV